MYFNSQRTHSQALTKENSRPTPNSGRSATDSSARALYRLYALAPANVGIARKNEKSVAAWRDRPSSMPPMMVEPLRLVPGIIAKH